MAHFFDPIDGNDQGGFMTNVRISEDNFKVGDKVLVLRFTQYNGYRAFLYGDCIYEVTKVTKHNVFVNIYNENEDKILTASNKFNKFGVRMKNYKYPYKYKVFYVLYSKKDLEAHDIIELIEAAGYRYTENPERLYNKVSELQNH